MKFLRPIKWFIQRGRRGYSDRDLWNLDSTIKLFLRNTIRDFQKLGNSYPSDFKSYEDWQKVLKEMENLFTEATKDVGFITDEKGAWDQKLYAKQSGRKKEMQNKAFDLLKKWCDGLWD